MSGETSKVPQPSRVAKPLVIKWNCNRFHSSQRKPKKPGRNEKTSRSQGKPIKTNGNCKIFHQLRKYQEILSCFLIKVKRWPNSLAFCYYHDRKIQYSFSYARFNSLFVKSFSFTNFFGFVYWKSKNKYILMPKGKKEMSFISTLIWRPEKNLGIKKDFQLSNMGKYVWIIFYMVKKKENKLNWIYSRVWK